MSMNISIVDQVRRATHKTNRLATIAGAILGGFVPLATFTLTHHEIDWQGAWYAQIHALLALGGLLYSAITVYRWGCVAFSMQAKALGFVILLEGVMSFSHTTLLSLSALFLLVTINAVATGCNLALDGKRSRAKERAGKKPGRKARRKAVRTPTPLQAVPALNTATA